MRKRYKLVQVDVFNTLIGALSVDPVTSFQRILGYRLNGENPLGVDPDSRFLKACLTSDIASPRDFADHIAKMFGTGPVSAEQLTQFELLLASERASVARYWDVDSAMRKLADAGIILCINSNLWPFAAEHILHRHGLAKLFHEDGLVLSYEEGFKKDDPEIYMVAPKRFGIDPSDCAFVGDSLQNDCLGPMKQGMKPFLLDRAGGFDGRSVPDGVTRIRDMMQLTEFLVG